MQRFVIAVGVGVAASLVGFLISQWRRERPQANSCGPYGKFDGGDQRHCTICLRSMFKGDSVKLPCNHKFHRSCIKNVFDQENKNCRSCPLCRSRFIDHEIAFIMNPSTNAADRGRALENGSRGFSEQSSSAAPRSASWDKITGPRL